jgi:hypothetical protein
MELSKKTASIFGERTNACLDWLRGMDLNHRPLGYEPNELPDCSTPHHDSNAGMVSRQTSAADFRFLDWVAAVIEAWRIVRKGCRKRLQGGFLYTNLGPEEMLKRGAICESAK